ncbi:hypothetical protein CR513_61902, partial [Mucuna pruriens]
MHLHDEAKIAFITDTRTFCYKVMLFGLKNVDTTYKRLMDKIFKNWRFMLRHGRQIKNSWGALQCIAMHCNECLKS